MRDAAWTTPEPALLTVAREAVGTVRAVRWRGNPHADARVWRVVGERGAAYVKQHGSARKFAQEATAYRELAPHAPSGTLPRLLSAAADVRALALSELPGEHPPATEAVFEAAGRWLAALHRAPYADADPLGVGEALSVRFDAWTAKAAPHVHAEDLLGARRAFAAANFAGVARVRCHRDYSPRNWLVAPAFFGVIDLEHALPDAPAWDLVRLEAEYHDRPALLAAFYAGYGEPPPAEQRRSALALFALGTIAWGASHGDAAFEAMGRGVLARVLAGA